MLPICYICLRSNIKLHVLEDDDVLVELYDDLCDIENYYQTLDYQFCTECVRKLKKCSDLKKHCNLARKVMKSWYKCSDRISIHELYRKIPASHNSISNSSNFMVYFHQAEELGMTDPIQISSFHPHIVTMNIPDDTNDETIDTMHIKQEIPEEIKDIEPLKLQVFTEHLTVSPENIKIEWVDPENETGLNDDELGMSGDHFGSSCDNLGISGDHFGSSCDNLGLSGDNFGLTGDNFGLTGDHFGSSGDENKQFEARRLDIENDQLSDESRSSNDELDSSGDEDDSENDKSLHDLLAKLKKMPTIKKEKQENKLEKESVSSNKQNKIVKLNERQRVLKGYKKDLKRMFEKSGDLKDDKGNSVDIENMLNGLDNMPLHYLRLCRKIIHNEKVLNTSIVKKLTEIQTQFLNFASVFDIVYLNDIAQVHAEFAKRREYPTFVSSQHRCEDCLQGFLSRKSLEYHCKAQHNPSLPISCVLCKMRFENKRNLSRHWSQLHSSVYTCKLCPYTVAHRGGMEAHYRRHVGLKYSCRHCRTDFNRRNQWYLHMNRYHKAKRALVHCVFCAYCTHSTAGLTLHYNRKHYGEKLTPSEDNKKCEECDTTFINEDVYRTHVRSSHQDSAVRVFKPRGNKKACVLCPAKGYGIPWMQEHFSKEHPTEDMEAAFKNKKRFLCDLCGKGYRFESALETHKHSHSASRDHACPHASCERTFVTNKSLMIHMERHLPPRHVCDECGKKFLSRPNLLNHMLTHRKDRRHKCDVCDKGFITKTLLNEHVRGVHLNIRRKRKRTAAEDLHD